MPYNYLWKLYQSNSSPGTDGALGLSGLLVLIGLWQVYKKAGIPSWWAIVPLGNLYKLFELTWGNGWWSLTLLIPFVNVIIPLLTSRKLATKFSRGWGFTLGLWLLPAIFYPILGFGSSQYEPGLIPPVAAR